MPWLSLEWFEDQPARFYYFAFIFMIIGQRLMELILSKNNENNLLKNGGLEIGQKNFRTMKIMHILFFFSLFMEASRHFYIPSRNLFIFFLLCIGVAQFLRLYSMLFLGARWTAKVIYVPGLKPVQNGIYKYFNHPGYVAVVLELAVIPLLAGLYYSATIFSLANLGVLYFRVKNESFALEKMELSA